MLKQQIQQIVAENPAYAAITPVIEKEILHHDILAVMVKQGAIQQLTFIGGTSLRLCYNSARLSEDLDFNGLEVDIQHYLQHKYETTVWVNKPNQHKQGNTSSWTISIIKEATRPDLPQQKIHIDVCAIPSFDIQKRPLLNHYNIMVSTEGILVPVQSLEEILVDKLIALAYRSRRIKPRDIWDIVWLKQRGIVLSEALVEQKIAARSKQKQDFIDVLNVQLEKLRQDGEVYDDFNKEMSRFIPQQIKERTIDNPDYWFYVQTEVCDVAKGLINKNVSKNKFDMGF